MARLASHVTFVCLLAGRAHADELGGSTTEPTVAAPATSNATGDEPSDAWHTYGALRNDVFTDLTPPIDDQGFTHDNVFSLRRQRGDLMLGGGFMHRWVTSNMDRRRWDQLMVLATVEHMWPHQLVTAARLGPSFGGNFGGQYLQNGWHALTKSGPTVEQGLANNYDGDRRLGVIAGAGARGAIGDAVQGYGIVDGQVALASGVTWLQVAAGGRASTRHVGLHVELAVTRYHVGDANLALPGAYGTGWQLEWRLGVHVAWSRFRVQYEYRANEGGSGEPIGVISFQSRR